MRSFLIACSFCLIVTTCLGQAIPVNPNLVDASGKRQGVWTLFVTDREKVTWNRDSAAYFRIITYQDDRPIGPVMDYYLVSLRKV